MHPEIEFIVVIRPRPQPHVGVGSNGITTYQANPVRVKTVMADDYEQAAEKAGVGAGETATVVPTENAKTFTRAEKAPLVAA